MSKVTSKLQVTIPKALAQRYGIHAGDEIEWEEAGAFIRVIPPKRRSSRLSVAERLSRFDEATARQRERDRRGAWPAAVERGWSREELYERVGSR